MARRTVEKRGGVTLGVGIGWRVEDDDISDLGGALEAVGDLLGHETVPNVEGRVHGQRRDEARLRRGAAGARVRS